MRTHWAANPTDTVMVNPEITYSSDEMLASEEGCLSHPGIYVKIPRSLVVRVTWQDEKGQVIKGAFETHTVVGTCNAAAIVQHEIDHLNGVNIIDKISPGQLLMLQRKLDKLRKAARR